MKPVLCLACIALAALGACGAPDEPDPDSPAVRVLPAGAERRDSTTPTVYVEIAADDESRRRGLGGRPYLAPDAGMLFVYADNRPRLFWMKDCLVSLDIAFLEDDGRIAQLATLPPDAGGQDPPRARSRAAVRYVLETPGGWFERHGVGPGDRVDLAAALDGVVPR